MHSALLWLGDILQVVSFAAILAGALMPTWPIALAVGAIPMTIWSVLRVCTIIAFGEDSPPMIGFVLGPVFAVVYVTLLRGLRMLIQRFLKRKRKGSKLTY